MRIYMLRMGGGGIALLKVEEKEKGVNFSI